jgi:cyclopropane fatty-acyl-phospholipid synthase-like methyltransferase
VSAVPSFVDSLRQMPVALFTADANEQHYEVETAFFDIALGKRKKYSAGLWDPGTAIADAGGTLLEAAEDRMLDAYVQRAGIEDGMSILDLGCGWGSVTLYLAERFPKARITGVSNSRTQRTYILEQARLRGFANVDVKTLNVARPEFDEFLIGLGGSLDRIISIEMFEHMKNYESLMRSLSVALKPQGKLFVHIMCHKYVSYHFEEDDLNGWMTTNFFKGGTMPSQFLLQGFQQDLVLENQWNVNGRNYTLTLEGWLQRMDKRREDLLGVFGEELQLRRWRVFMIACAEYFRFRGGSEFFVTHLLFKKRA